MLKLMQVNCVVVVLVCVANAHFRTVAAENGESALDLILLHNNDLHGRFVESTIDRSDCHPEESLANKCYGGFARISTLIKRHRYDHQKNNGLPVLFLNAGDTYVGTPWFYLFKHKIATELMSVLRPDVGVSIHIFFYMYKKNNSVFSLVNTVTIQLLSENCKYFTRNITIWLILFGQLMLKKS